MYMMVLLAKGVVYYTSYSTGATENQNLQKRLNIQEYIKTYFRILTKNLKVCDTNMLHYITKFSINMLYMHLLQHMSFIIEKCK